MKNAIMPYVLIFVLGIGLMFVMSFIGLGNMKEIAAEKEGGGEKTEETAATNPEDIYKKSCIGCHGDQYQGGVGPALKGLPISQDEIKDILINGTTGGMPGGLIPGQEDAMAEWLANLK
ncbi:cytochrome c [Bacillus sp. Bva_UNVM-123]|uniref:cytochrome c550 n=1 Tax=Bacillus sp. Bva_UNVM-123 TaxID=2829798 RepID=UPI00391F12B3